MIHVGPGGGCFRGGSPSWASLLAENVGISPEYTVILHARACGTLCCPWYNYSMITMQEESFQTMRTKFNTHAPGFL